ncbi:MAG: hypothetical protein V4509_00970 [Patescibacteria group bacterium]
MYTNRNICIIISVVGILVALGLHLTQPYIADRNAKMTAFGETVAKIIALDLKDEGLPLKEPTLYDVDGARVMITIEIDKTKWKP